MIADIVNRLKIYILSLFFLCAPALGQTPTIAVASNMKPVIEEIYTAFRADNKSEIKMVYGSSGNFFSQIRNGAPFSLFVSADEYYPLELVSAGLTQGDGKTYAIGRLAMIINKKMSFKPTVTTPELKKLFSEANKISIAKPELAPYGKASIQFLTKMELLGQVKDKLVYAENISIATVFVSSGSASVGFTALSLAMSPEAAKTTNFVVIPDHLYEPIKQRMVLLKKAPPLALEFYEFMQSSTAKQILKTHGYLNP